MCDGTDRPDEREKNHKKLEAYFEIILFVEKLNIFTRKCIIFKNHPICVVTQKKSEYFVGARQKMYTT